MTKNYKSKNQKKGFMQSISKWVAPVLIGASLLGVPGCNIKPPPENEAATMLRNIKQYGEISNSHISDYVSYNNMGPLPPTSLNNQTYNQLYFPTHVDRDLKISKENLLQAKQKLEYMAKCENLPHEKRKVFQILSKSLGGIETSVERAMTADKENPKKEGKKVERYSLKKEHVELVEVLNSIDREIKYFNGVGPQEYGLRQSPNPVIPLIIAGIFSLLLILVNMNINGFVISNIQLKVVNLAGVIFFFIWIALLLIIIKKHN